MKTPGQLDYEADVQQKPLYHNGKPRKTWKELPEICRWSWERRATTHPPTTPVLLSLFFALTALSACAAPSQPPANTLLYVDCGGTARNISLAEYRNQPRCVQI